MVRSAMMRQSPAGLRGEKRHTPRSSVSLPVLIETAGRQHSARLHNLSLGGAMLEAAIPLDVGTRITINCGTIDADATVIWDDFPRAGIEFASSVDEADLIHQLARSRAAEDRRDQRRQKAEMAADPGHPDSPFR
ncbi:MAG: PilZ domain-containing protein [Sphingomonadales bacterium]